MFNNISWNEYIMTVALLLAIYYLFVGLRYYPAEIKGFLFTKQKPEYGLPRAHAPEVYDPGVEADAQDTDDFEDGPSDEFAEVEHLIERLKDVISDASGRKMILEEFKHYLSMVLKEHPSVKYSPLRPSINELIITECQKAGVVTLDNDEVELLWMNVV